MAKKSEETLPSNDARKPASFEEALAQLQEIVRELESGERSLDDSLKLYEQGIASLRTCHTFLDQAEQRIRKLVSGAGGKVTEASFVSAELSGETEVIAADPGHIASGPTQVIPAVPDEKGTGEETQPRKPPVLKRTRGTKDGSLFCD